MLKLLHCMVGMGRSGLCQALNGEDWSHGSLRKMRISSTEQETKSGRPSKSEVVYGLSLVYCHDEL